MRVEHLICSGCDSHPTAARVDGDLELVCHCTHVDSDVDAVPITGNSMPPDRWEFHLDAGGDDE